MLISVVIPTRDRPEFVRNALTSLTLQSFTEFDVIVSDNHTGRPCKDVVAGFDDPRFRYCCPPRPLPVHDSWEHAVSQATGDYVTLLIDKTMLHINALETLAQAVNKRRRADVYSWASDAYHLMNEAGGDLENGYLVPVAVSGKTLKVNRRAELRRRLRFDCRLGLEGPAYYFGKICFGAYSRSLIERMKKCHGRLFSPITPDYTSMMRALLLAHKVVHFDRALAISFISETSNGAKMLASAPHNRQFLAQAGFAVEDFERLPIPRVYASAHNMVAHDCREALNTGANLLPGPQLDLANIAARVTEDLALVSEWDSEEEERQQKACLESYVASLEPSLKQRYSASLTSESELSPVIAGFRTITSAASHVQNIASGGARTTIKHLHWRQLVADALYLVWRCAPSIYLYARGRPPNLAPQPPSQKEPPPAAKVQPRSVEHVQTQPIAPPQEIYPKFTSIVHALHGAEHRRLITEHDNRHRERMGSD